MNIRRLFLFVALLCSQPVFASSVMVSATDIDKPNCNCIKDHQSCSQNLNKNWNLDKDCSQEPCTPSPTHPNANSTCKKTDLDYVSCQLYKTYGKTFSMAIAGDSNTEGAYVKCNEGSSLENCKKNGAFSIVTDITQATMSEKIATSDGVKIKNPGTEDVFYCPLMRCDVKTPDIKFKIGSTYSALIADQLFSYSVIGSNVNYKNVTVGNNSCIMVNLPVGWVYLGCKQKSPTSSSSSPPTTNSCFVKTACTHIKSEDRHFHTSGSTGSLSVNVYTPPTIKYQHSKSFFSLSGRIVECVSDVLNILFFNKTCNDSKNFLPALQDNLRHAVMAAMLLYVMLFGVRVATGDEPPQKAEVFMFVLKIALVLYFSVGLKNASGEYESGLAWVFGLGKSAMTSLSEYVLNAASTNGLCNYNPNEYDKGYSYLALWDSLDCRVAYYLGLYNLTAVTASSLYGIFGLIIPLLFSMEILLLIFIIVYGIFILSFVIYFVHFYVIALVALAITTYIGVIIVPMALFGYTKQFFDKWLKVLMSYVLQPVVVCAFLAVSMMIFDSIIFGDCAFTTVDVGKYTFWTIDGNSCHTEGDPRCSSTTTRTSCLTSNSCATTTDSWASMPKCKESIGWLLIGQLDQSLINIEPVIFLDFAFASIKPGTLGALMTAFLKVILFAYLMSLFSETLNDFAAELTSGPNIGKFAVDPGNLFKKMMDKLRKGKESKGGKGGKDGKGSGTKVSKSAPRKGVKMSAAK
jgi:type IV secretory pathway VirB6-like protein